MKKIILIFLALVALINVYAIHKQYIGGYEFVPSKINTKHNDYAMSFMKNKVVYSVKDTVSGEIKLYSADILKSDIEFKGAKEVKEMADLGIFGTFAYDESLNKIYFSRYDKSTNNYMLYESTQKD